MVTEGPGTGSEYELEQAAILGRLDSNDIPVHDRKASREHAKIYKQGAQYAVVDLNSSNGTFVNGEKITKRVLEDGDEIRIGVVCLRYEDAEAAAAKEAALAGRKSLDDAFDRGQEKKGETPAKPADVVMRGHKPIQYARVKPGNPILGFDLDQLSDTGRFVIYLSLVAVFALLMWLGYKFVAV